jgi:hypothetical protein
MKKQSEQRIGTYETKNINANFLSLPECKCCLNKGESSACKARLSYSATIAQIERGFDKGYCPKLTDDGTSGCYMLRGNSRKPVAIFKPIDEEQFAPNNPRDFSGPFGSSTFRPGIVSGESTIREIAAYLLDHGHFSGVPMTSMAAISHESFKLANLTPPSDTLSLSSFNSSEAAGQSIY